MELVEEGKLDGPEMEDYLHRLFAPYRDTPVDAVVLGCTHYVFLHPILRRLLPAGTAILDGNAGAIRQLRRVLEERNALRPEGASGRVELHTSGDEALVLPRHEAAAAAASMMYKTVLSFPNIPAMFRKTLTKNSFV